MFIKLNKLTGASAVALALAAMPIAAQDVVDWDADADSVLSEDEFATGLGETGMFDEWDADGDELLNEEEFGAGYGDTAEFDHWDADSDGFVSGDEFGSRVYGSYDADESGAIEESELGAVGYEGGLFDIDPLLYERLRTRPSNSRE